MGAQERFGRAVAGAMQRRTWLPGRVEELFGGPAATSRAAGGGDQGVRRDWQAAAIDLAGRGAEVIMSGPARGRIIHACKVYRCRLPGMRSVGGPLSPVWSKISMVSGWMCW